MKSRLVIERSRDEDEMLNHTVRKFTSYFLFRIRNVIELNLCAFAVKLPMHSIVWYLSMFSQPLIQLNDEILSLYKKDQI